MRSLEINPKSPITLKVLAYGQDQELIQGATGVGTQFVRDGEVRSWLIVQSGSAELPFKIDVPHDLFLQTVNLFQAEIVRRANKLAKNVLKRAKESDLVEGGAITVSKDIWDLISQSSWMDLYTDSCRLAGEQPLAQGKILGSVIEVDSTLDPDMCRLGEERFCVDRDE